MNLQIETLKLSNGGTVDAIWLPFIRVTESPNETGQARSEDQNV